MQCSCLLSCISQTCVSSVGIIDLFCRHLCNTLRCDKCILAFSSGKRHTLQGCNIRKRTAGMSKACTHTHASSVCHYDHQAEATRLCKSCKKYWRKNRSCLRLGAGHTAVNIYYMDAGHMSIAGSTNGINNKEFSCSRA